MRRPYEVFVNGVAQTESDDHEVIGSSLNFPRRFARERKLEDVRWTLLFLGVWRCYRHHDTIDVVYASDGRRLPAADRFGRRGVRPVAGRPRTAVLASGVVLGALMLPTIASAHRRGAIVAALPLASVAPPPIAGEPSVRPWPVGPGGRYRPGAATAAVTAGRPVARFRCAAPGAAFPVHLEIFADRRVVVVPAGIGVAAPFLRAGAVVVPLGCVYPVSTRAPTGVVEVARGLRLSLADLFRIWGQPLGRARIASFRARTPVRVYLDGQRVSGPVGAITLRPRSEIVLELGGYVAPHPFFLFAGAWR